MTVPIDDIDVAAYTVPTDAPESDGTFAWDSTTIVLVRARGGGRVGTGWTYEHVAAATLISDRLGPVVRGADALRVQARWDDMVRAVRNIRFPGIAAYAVSAVDTALWDLKARVMERSLVDVLDARHADVPVYGSGGFTSYTEDRLRRQLGAWVADGIPRVKMKVGREAAHDLDRVAAARDAVGPSAELYVDANGAFHRQQALAFADACADHDVTWFEEPVSSDDVEGLRLLRDNSPPGMEISAGEYGTTVYEFRRLLDAGAVDCLQADVTRCGGISGVTRVGTLCETAGVDLSAHTAPQLSAHAFAAVGPLRHIEWFHDHVRIEERFFDGVLAPTDGTLRPDRQRSGHGLDFKEIDAEPHFASRRTAP